ncbi:Isoaspartyl peptidase [Austwickia sp. TVS 96-490-7B]|nr:Isoaspartyl peptidase [Austwickia sp. TVS 96-490-7B]
MTQVQLLEFPPAARTSLVVHGGAGALPSAVDPEFDHACRDSLRAAIHAGRHILDNGGDALDAVCAAVTCLEDQDHFNAGRGAALTSEGLPELDAAVMTGAGSAGAVTCTDIARNPVAVARAVMEHTPHVLLAAPPASMLHGWGCRTEDPQYFVTERRRRQLTLSSSRAHRHGTVGAVARDHSGKIAAATSTGGVTGQLPGRIGDTPLIGAGTWADDTTCGVSCTGTGEFFMRAVLAHDVHARIRYAGMSLPQAATSAVRDGLEARGGDGALIAVDRSGTAVVAWNSPTVWWAVASGQGALVGGDRSTEALP